MTEDVLPSIQMMMMTTAADCTQSSKADMKEPIGCKFVGDTYFVNRRSFI